MTRVDTEGRSTKQRPQGGENRDDGNRAHCPSCSLGGIRFAHERVELLYGNAPDIRAGECPPGGLALKADAMLRAQLETLATARLKRLSMSINTILVPCSRFR